MNSLRVDVCGAEQTAQRNAQILAIKYRERMSRLFSAGGTMFKLLTNAAPLGRLYDPLPALATRIHRLLGTRRKTVWTDLAGGVFVDKIACMSSMSPCSIVGTYDASTPWLVIEDDLRLALRERASRWITDWNKRYPSISRKEYRLNSNSPPRGRPLRARLAIVGTSPRGIPSPPAIAESARLGGWTQVG